MLFSGIFTIVVARILFGMWAASLIRKQSRELDTEAYGYTRLAR